MLFVLSLAMFFLVQLCVIFIVYCLRVYWMFSFLCSFLCCDIDFFVFFMHILVLFICSWRFYGFVFFLSFIFVCFILLAFRSWMGCLFFKDSTCLKVFKVGLGVWLNFFIEVFVWIIAFRIWVCLIGWLSYDS